MYKRQGYTDLIHTSINSKGSATYQNAIQAREEFYEDHPQTKESFHIHIIDSRNYTMSYGWAVVEGAKMEMCIRDRSSDERWKSVAEGLRGLNDKQLELVHRFITWVAEQTIG